MLSVSLAGSEAGSPTGVISHPQFGLFFFPTLLLEKDLAMADQFLKGETMSVHQVEAATSKLQPQQRWLPLPGAPTLSPP